MNELKAFDYNGQKVIDSRDVAVMVERNHKDLLRDIRLYIEYLGEDNFLINERNFAPIDFFIESSYTDSRNRTMPCYLITKKGCDLIANKLTGKKGVLFTAAYVTAFEEMKQAIINPVEVSPGGLAKLISITRRVMLDMGSTPQDVGLAMQNIYKTWRVPVPELHNSFISEQLDFSNCSILPEEYQAS